MSDALQWIAVALVVGGLGLIFWGFASTTGASLHQSELDLEFDARRLWGACPHCHMAARPEARMLPDRSMVSEHHCRAMREAEKAGQ